jgi:hypothetical protein
VLILVGWVCWHARDGEVSQLQANIDFVCPPATDLSPSADARFAYGSKFTNQTAMSRADGNWILNNYDNEEGYIAAQNDRFALDEAFEGGWDAGVDAGIKAGEQSQKYDMCRSLQGRYD